MRTGLSLQQKGPGRVSLPLQAPSRKPSLLSKLALAPAIRSYSPTAFLTAFICRRQDTNPVISSANVSGSAKGTQHRAGFFPSSLSLRSRGSKARTYRKRTRGIPAGPNARSLTPSNALRLHAPLPEGFVISY